MACEEHKELQNLQLNHYEKASQIPTSGPMEPHNIVCNNCSLNLPPGPQEPQDSDFCGMGCIRLPPQPQEPHVSLHPRPQEPLVNLPPHPQEPHDTDCHGVGSVNLHPRPQEPHINLPPLPQEPHVNLPPRPQEPQDSDCCGSGCTPCVFDLYDQDLRLWQKECERLQNGPDLNPSAQCSVLSPEEYHRFELVNIEEETHNTSRYRFKIAHNQKLPISVGQHLVLRCQDQNSSVIKQYTPISDPDTSGHFEFVIKLYEDGAMSRHIEKWRIGDQVEWRGPFGNYSYQPNKFRQVLMLAAGTGIAPMVQMVRHILHNPEDETTVHLMYACKSYTDILCKSCLQEWTGFWNFQLTVYLSQETEDSVKSKRKYGENIVCSRILESHIKNCIQDAKNCQVLICGTKSFDKDMLNFVNHQNIADIVVHKF